MIFLLLNLHLSPHHTSHPALPLPTAGRELVLEVLQALTSNTQIVKEAIQKGRHSTTTQGEGPVDSGRWVGEGEPESPYASLSQVPLSTC